MKILQESSIDSLINVIGNYNVATISAFRKTNNYDENRLLSNQLYNDLKTTYYDNDTKQSCYGVYRLEGGYPEKLTSKEFVDKNGNNVDKLTIYGKTYWYQDVVDAERNNQEIVIDVIEDSYLVINYDLDFESFKEDMCLLCKEYNQDSVLIKDEDGVFKLFDGDLNVVVEIGDKLDFAITEYWSRLIDCSEKDKISWSITEQIIHKRKNRFNSLNELILFDYVKKFGEHNSSFTGNNIFIRNGSKLMFENVDMYRFNNYLYVTFNDVDWYRIKKTNL